MKMNGNNAGKALSKYQPCIDPWFTMSILWNGDIVPCCGDYSGAYVIGNASETQLREAWNNGKITALRRNLINRPQEKTSILLCESCDRLFEKKMLGIPVRNWKYFLKERFHYK
jgi:radical SAM protein with 4Fe4S-binding SPASM domain